VNIKLALVIVSLIAFCVSSQIVFADTAWLEASYRAAAALKGGNLESAEEYLEKALPDVQKMSEATIESTGRKPDVEALCATYDGWKRASEEADQEKRKLKRIEEAKEPARKESLQNQMTEMRREIDEQLKAGRTNLQLLETAINIRKKLYGPQDQTTLNYLSDLRYVARAQDTLKNLRSITESKTHSQSLPPRQ